VVIALNSLEHRKGAARFWRHHTWRSLSVGSYHSTVLLFALRCASLRFEFSLLLLMMMLQLRLYCL